MNKFIISAWVFAVFFIHEKAQTNMIYARGYEGKALGVKMAEGRNADIVKKLDTFVRVLPDKAEGLYPVEPYKSLEDGVCWQQQQEEAASVEQNAVVQNEKLLYQDPLAQWRQIFNNIIGKIPISEIKAFLREAGRDGLLHDTEKAFLAEFTDRFEPPAAALYRNIVGLDQPGNINHKHSTGLNVDKAAVIIDLKRQRAYVDSSLVRKENLAGLVERLKVEGARKPLVYNKIIAKIAPGGQLIDDFTNYPVVSGHQLGLTGNNHARLFVSFPVGSGKAKGRSYLTPTGTFVIGQRLVNREAKRWDVPSGFNRDPRNPFGPRFLRLNQVLADGRTSPTEIGLHGTAANATWMYNSDGARAVSKGCVRLPNDVIVRLDRYLQPGAVVQIINSLNYRTDIHEEQS